MASDDNFVNFDNTSFRKDNYGEIIKQIREDKICPFCPEQLSKYHKNPIIENRKYWLATENMYPYKGAKFHLLLIHKKHLTHISELTKEAWAELQNIINDLVKENKIPGGSLMFRFGDTRYTGASVTHLHAQIISGDPTNESYQPIITRVG